MVLGTQNIFGGAARFWGAFGADPSAARLDMLAQSLNQSFGSGEVADQQRALMQLQNLAPADLNAVLGQLDPRITAGLAQLIAGSSGYPGAGYNPDIASRGQNLGIFTDGPSAAQVQRGDGILQLGHRGEGVAQLQRSLNAMGANVPVDGHFGPETDAAVRNFNTAMGFGNDGTVDARKLDTLNRGGTLTPQQWNQVQPNYTVDKVQGAIQAQQVTAERALQNGPIRVAGDDGSPLPGGTRGLLDQISRGEGTSDAAAHAAGYKSGYDVALANGKYGGSPKEKPISQMTLGEVKQLQARMLANPKNTMNSSAVGKYQIVGKTLRSLQKEMKLPDSTVFSPKVQDKMAMHLLERRGLSKFQNGKISAAKFQNNIAKEWASFARADTKKSAYGQHTGTTAAQGAKAIAGVKNDGKSKTTGGTNGKSTGAGDKSGAKSDSGSKSGPGGRGH
ncbi:MAG: peptidoglycan-binding protein [Myxococcota bacterium]